MEDKIELTLSIDPEELFKEFPFLLEIRNEIYTTFVDLFGEELVVRDLLSQSIVKAFLYVTLKKENDEA